MIAVSAAASTDHRAACLLARADVLLTKPVSLETLRAHIGQRLGLQWIESISGRD